MSRRKSLLWDDAIIEETENTCPENILPPIKTISISELQGKEFSGFDSTTVTGKNESLLILKSRKSLTNRRVSEGKGLNMVDYYSLLNRSHLTTYGLNKFCNHLSKPWKMVALINYEHLIFQKLKLEIPEHHQDVLEVPMERLKSRNVYPQQESDFTCQHEDLCRQIALGQMIIDYINFFENRPTTLSPVMIPMSRNINLIQVYNQWIKDNSEILK